MNAKGYLIILEGPDGIGKTTLSQDLADTWNSEGIASVYYSFPGKEPSTLGNLIYRLHHESEVFGVQSINPVSRQIMHIAAHVDAIDRIIRPALKEGKRVILDRFWWSTWVYGQVDGISASLLNTLIKVEKEYWGETLPIAACLITREHPLRVETSAERWAELTHLYDELAKHEESWYSVFRIPNEHTIESALRMLREKIELAISNSASGTSTLRRGDV